MATGASSSPPPTKGPVWAFKGPARNLNLLDGLPGNLRTRKADPTVCKCWPACSSVLVFSHHDHGFGVTITRDSHAPHWNLFTLPDSLTSQDSVPAKPLRQEPSEVWTLSLLPRGVRHRETGHLSKGAHHLRGPSESSNPSHLMKIHPTTTAPAHHAPRKPRASSKMPHPLFPPRQLRISQWE